MTVHLLDTADGPDVLRAGAAHPVLGGLVDLGTAAPLTASIGAVRSLCAELSGEVRLVERSGPLRAELRAEVETAAEPVFVVLPLAADAVLVLAAGPELPSMGLLPAGDLALLRASLLAALGKPDGDSLFTEPAAGFGAEAERRLDDRLRQLYGE